MKLEFFKPSDFELSNFERKSIKEQFCEQANAKLERDAVKVKGCRITKKGLENWAFDSNYDDETTTHTAFLFNIQPIKECEHEKEPIKTYFITGEFGGFKCQDCNKQLEPTGWRIKE